MNVSSVIPRNESKINVDEDDYSEVDCSEEMTLNDAAAVEDRRRDEVVEVRKMSSRDSNRLRLWRVVVTCVLLLTAFAVTFTTFTLLTKQEEKNFKTAVRDYSDSTRRPFFTRT
jgi:uncharacterized membrane protein YcjF (UPF0283 family)